MTILIQFPLGARVSLSSCGAGSGAIQDLHRTAYIRHAEEERSVARFVYSGVAVLDVYVGIGQLRRRSSHLARPVRETNLRNFGFGALHSLSLNGGLSRGGIVHDESDLTLASHGCGLKSENIYAAIGKRLADLSKSTRPILQLNVEFFGPWHSRSPPAEYVTSDLLHGSVIPRS